MHLRENASHPTPSAFLETITPTAIVEKLSHSIKMSHLWHFLQISAAGIYRAGVWSAFLPCCLLVNTCNPPTAPHSVAILFNSEEIGAQVRLCKNKKKTFQPSPP